MIIVLMTRLTFFKIYFILNVYYIFMVGSHYGHMSSMPGFDPGPLSHGSHRLQSVSNQALSALAPTATATP